MLKKRVISVFFLMLFSFQLLPLRQVGSLLYSNQLMEEISHGSETGNAKFGDTSKNIDYFFTENSISLLSLAASLLLSPLDDNFKSRSSDDIQTPPPNFHA